MFRVIGWILLLVCSAVAMIMFVYYLNKGLSWFTDLFEPKPVPPLRGNYIW